METQLRVNVKPGSKTPGISKSDRTITLRVRERAIEGAANAACIRALAEVLGVAPSRIRLMRGERSRQKLFTIQDVDEESVFELIAAQAVSP